MRKIAIILGSYFGHILRGSAQGHSQLGGEPWTLKIRKGRRKVGKEKGNGKKRKRKGERKKRKKRKEEKKRNREEKKKEFRPNHFYWY